VNIVVTMAGLGSRFRKAGYNVPKYMIEVKGKTLFYLSVMSLQNFELNNSRCIFIVREEDNAKAFIDSECYKLGISQREIVEIDHLTDGQATTALFAKPFWAEDKPLAIYNIDTHVTPNALYKDTADDQGWIPCFSAPGENWSFVKLDESGRAVEVREKKRISDNSTIGLYWFASPKIYEDAYNKYYSQANREEKGERYIAPIYNQLIEDGHRVTISSIPKDAVHILGTPEELKDYLGKTYDVE
jgi:dTDP-glucose pyrophosphorylase